MKVAIINIDGLRFFRIIYYHWDIVVDNFKQMFNWKHVLEQAKLFGNSLSAGIFWTGWNFAFGLIPLFVLCKCKLLDSADLNFITLLHDGDVTKNIIREGAILFVSAALMGEVLVDYLLSDLNIKFLSAGMFIFTGIILWANESIFEWFAFHGKITNDTSMVSLVKMQGWIILISVIYCVFIKSLLLYTEKIKPS